MQTSGMLTVRNGKMPSPIYKETDLCVELDYVSPGRHAQNPAERACGITECVIKAILMQNNGVNNLPPHFWAKAAKDA